MNARLFLLLGCGGLLASCAGTGTGDFPSLAKRDYESEAPLEVPPLPPPEEGPGLDTAERARIIELSEQAAAAAAGFDAALPGVRDLVMRAGDAPPGAESWVVAQVALSGLEADRHGAVEALADLDALYIGELEEEAAGGAPGGAAALEELRDAIAETLRKQEAIVAGLAARLSE